MQSEIEELERKLSELRRERGKLKEGIAAEEVTIAAVREELSAEQIQLDKERKQIETRDTELKKEEVGQLSHLHLIIAVLASQIAGPTLLTLHTQMSYMMAIMLAAIISLIKSQVLVFWENSGVGLPLLFTKLC